MAVALQSEFAIDDPRQESQGIMADIREFMDASRECGGLLTVGQAAKILDVSPGHISTWAGRGRIKAKVVLGVRMVSAGEVLALKKERDSEGVSLGGRGRKAASLADMVSAAWQDIEPLK
jgi:hypothetical protein